MIKLNDLPDTPPGYVWYEHDGEGPAEAGKVFGLVHAGIPPKQGIGKAWRSWLDYNGTELGLFSEDVWTKKVRWRWNFRTAVFDNWNDAMLTTITRHKFGGFDEKREVF